MDPIEKTKLEQVASYLKICAEQLKQSAPTLSLKVSALSGEVKQRVQNLEAAAAVMARAEPGTAR